MASKSSYYETLQKLKSASGATSTTKPGNMSGTASKIGQTAAAGRKPGATLGKASHSAVAPVKPGVRATTAKIAQAANAARKPGATLKPSQSATASRKPGTTKPSNSATASRKPGAKITKPSTSATSTVKPGTVKPTKRDETMTAGRKY